MTNAHQSWAYFTDYNSVDSSLTFLREDLEYKNVSIVKPLLSLTYAKQERLFNKSKDRTLQHVSSGLHTIFL